MLDLKIKPFMASNTEHDTIRVTVDYDKQQKGPVVRIQAARVENEGGFEVFRVVLFGSPTKSVPVETGWKTNNKKKMEEVRNRVCNEVKAKTGPVFEAISKMLNDHGTEIIG